MNKRKRISKKRGRPTKDGLILPKLKSLGVFRQADAHRLGLSQSTLTRWVTQGKLRRLARGLFIHLNAPSKTEEQDYIVACAKFGPEAAIGGMTALFYHGLIEQDPQRIWVIVPYRVQTKDPFYRCIRSKTDSKKGVDDLGTFRITNVERTLVEALRYSSKMGLRTALRAVRTALANKQTSLQKIYNQAKSLGLEKFVERHWEAIVPEGDAA